MAKQHRSSASPVSPTTAAPPRLDGVEQPHGNAALAESFLAHAEQSRGTEIALDPGRALGMMAGLGIGALNAFGAGGVNAALSPAGYWDLMNEPARPTEMRSGRAVMAKPL